MSGEVVMVAGAMAQQPKRSDHAWVFVSWHLDGRVVARALLRNAMGECAVLEDVG